MPTPLRANAPVPIVDHLTIPAATPERCHSALSGAPYLGLKKINRNLLRVAIRHNLREIPAEIGPGKKIDADRVALNKILVGESSSSRVEARALALIKEAGANIRKNCVMAIELVFSLPQGTHCNLEDYFGRALSWATDFFKVQAISAIVHMDEGAPHCHVLLLPLVNNRMQGSELAGGIAKFRAMQTSFYDLVAKPFGLARPNLSTKKKNAPRLNEERLIDQLEKLVAGSALSQKGRAALLGLLGSVERESKARAKRAERQRTFVEIMTRPCRPDRERHPDLWTSIRFPKNSNTKRSNPYVSVGNLENRGKQEYHSPSGDKGTDSAGAAHACTSSLLPTCLAPQQSRDASTQGCPAPDARTIWEEPRGEHPSHYDERDPISVNLAISLHAWHPAALAHGLPPQYVLGGKYSLLAVVANNRSIVEADLQCRTLRGRTPARNVRDVGEIASRSGTCVMPPLSSMRPPDKSPSVTLMRQDGHQHPEGNR